MAKGKYAGIIDALPREFGLEPDYQEKVEAIKTKILEPDESVSEPMNSEAVEDFVGEIAAMLQVLNDNMIRSMGGNKHASRLARVFRDLRVIKDAMEKQEKVTNLLLEAYKQLLVDQFEAEGTTNLTLDDGGSIRVQLEPHSKVVDKDANRKWAIENGLESALSLPWQTVNALTKQALLDGEEPPSGVEAVARPKVVYTKG